MFAFLWATTCGALRLCGALRVALQTALLESLLNHLPGLPCCPGLRLLADCLGLGVHKVLAAEAPQLPRQAPQAGRLARLSWCRVHGVEDVRAQQVLPPPGHGGTLVEQRDPRVPVREDRRATALGLHRPCLQLAFHGRLWHVEGRLPALKIIVEVNDEGEPRAAAGVDVVHVLLAASWAGTHTACGPGPVEVLAVHISLCVAVEPPAAVEPEQPFARKLLGQCVHHAREDCLVLRLACHDYNVLRSLIQRGGQRNVRPVADGLGNLAEGLTFDKGEHIG
mmetsp:Transcript_138814/g.387111  ORF Transcript_138814/g.387111 Transcript_138814/m.387111 type:complete len:280 (+) Transcript_138814:254-1093(+)